MRLRDAIKATLSRPVAFHAVLGKVCGSATAGLMLSQAIYWSERTNDQSGWFYKTQAEWEEEICLSRWEQETARKRLRERGFLAEQLRGNPARLYYRVEIEAVARAVAQYAEKPQTSLRDDRKRQSHALDCGKPANKDAGNPQTLKGTETSPETTTEKNPGNATSALPASHAKDKTPVEERQEPVDPRYQPVVDAISKCWPEGVPFAFDKTDGKQLKNLLERRPKSEWPAERLQECVVFRFWSDCTVPTESVRKWIGAVTDYAFGPLDRYKQPKFSGHQLDDLRRQARIFLGLEQQPQPATSEPICPPPGVQQTAKAEEAWKAILEHLARAINPHTFSTWFRPTKGYGERDSTLFVHVPTRLFRKRLTEIYSDQVKEALRAKASGFTEIEFICLTTG
jgi:hypothetical protein